MRKDRLARRSITVTAVILTALVCISAMAWAIPYDKVPNPREKGGLFVEDAGGVLGPEYIALIDSICQALKNQTGSEIAVITVDDLEGIPIEDYAVRLFERFGIGEKGRDNGLLILFSRDDREIRMEVGYGLEHIIPDARASRLLDDFAIPHFKEDLPARGLYAASLAAAEHVASATGASLGITEPAEFPAQVTPPPPVEDETLGEQKPDAFMTTLYFTGAIFLLILLGLVFVFLRVQAKKSKSAKKKAVNGHAFFLTVMWIGVVVGFIVVGNITGVVVPILISGILSPIVATILQFKVVKWLRRRVAGYQAKCPECGERMSLLDERADDAQLSPEEIAEEHAGGMDYEIWECSQCGGTKRFRLKLAKAGKCPECKRRTLVETTTTLAASTYKKGGRVRISSKCKNPGCGYSKTKERSTPRRSRSGSSSSGRSSSSYSSGRSSSSFGGGRSGGGGASKSW